MVLVVKNPTANAGDKRDAGLIPWRRESQLTPVFLPGESHGQRSLVGYSPWGSESQTWLKQLSTAAPHNQGQFWYQKSSMNLFAQLLPKVEGKGVPYWETVLHDPVILFFMSYSSFCSGLLWKDFYIIPLEYGSSVCLGHKGRFII